MNADLANIIKEYLEPLNFVDKITGLVRPLIKTDVVEVFNDDNEKIGEQIIKKVFPVSCDVTHKQCFEEGHYADLVPNDEYISIIYFEDRGTVLTGTQGRLHNYTSGLRLVCWLNMERFDTSACSISAPVIAAIVKAIPTGTFNADGTAYQRISVQLASILPKTSAIFGAYTYNEETNQYLLYPYDYFAIDLNVSFSIHDNCIETLTIKDKDC